MPKQTKTKRAAAPRAAELAPLTLTVTIPGKSAALFKGLADMIIAEQWTNPESAAGTIIAPGDYAGLASYGVIAWITGDECMCVMDRAIRAILKGD